MPVVNRMTKELIACGVISASRYYLYFDGNSSITLPPVSMTGARTITMMFRVPNALNDYIRLYGYGTSTPYSRIYISAAGVLSFSPDNTTPIASTTAGKVLPNVTYALEVNISAAGWYLKINGVVLFSSTTDLTATTTTVDHIGESYNTKSRSVYMWDVNFNNQRIYKLDKNVYPSLVFKDSISGQDGQGYNFQESSFVRSINA
jgi:hypothetical protein